MFSGQSGRYKVKGHQNQSISCTSIDFLGETRGLVSQLPSRLMGFASKTSLVTII